MDYKALLVKDYGDMILDAKATSEFNTPTLEITINTTSHDVVDTWAKKLRDQLDTKTWFNPNWSIIVLSKGSPTELDLNNLGSAVGKTIKLQTKKSFESLNIFIGELLLDQETKILVRWNKKGLIRKIEFDKANIIKIEEYYKF